MSARQSPGITRHDVAGRIVESVGGIGQPVVVPSRCYDPIPAQPDPNSGTSHLQILPPELIGKSQVVVNVGNKLIKSATDTVFRVAITRCKIILSKQPSLEAEVR